MPEKTKREKDARKQKEKEAVNPFEAKDENAVRDKDQRGKSYYYDDAHGYEIYNPDQDDEEENQL